MFPPAAPVLPFVSAAAFEAWLEVHVGATSGVWLKLAKKESGIPSLSADEAVDVGLCFGWISGQRKGLDDTHYLQKYVPRRAHSLWSRVNVLKVEALTAAGRMRPAGLAEVAAAKSDGRWDAAYAPQRDVTIPPDLIAVLEAHPAASRAFAALNKTAQYRVIHRLLTSRNAELRARRLREVVAELEAHRGTHRPARTDR